MQANLDQSIGRLKDDMLSALMSLRSEMEKFKKENGSYTLSMRSARVSKLAERGRLMTNATQVLKSLYFPGMESRRTRIVEAHHETCQWA